MSDAWKDLIHVFERRWCSKRLHPSCVRALQRYTLPSAHAVRATVRQLDDEPLTFCPACGAPVLVRIHYPPLEPKK